MIQPRRPSSASTGIPKRAARRSTAAGDAAATRAGSRSSVHSCTVYVAGNRSAWPVRCECPLGGRCQLLNVDQTPFDPTRLGNGHLRMSLVWTPQVRLASAVRSGPNPARLHLVADSCAMRVGAGAPEATKQASRPSASSASPRSHCDTTCYVAIGGTECVTAAVIPARRGRTGPPNGSRCERRFNGGCRRRRSWPGPGSPGRSAAGGGCIPASSRRSRPARGSGTRRC